MVKLVVAEDSSNVAHELWESSQQPVSSVLCVPESRAALAAARRAGRLTAAAHRRAAAELEELTDQMALVEVGDSLAREGGSLAEQFALPGYDAMHLASAMRVGAKILITWDRELERAAEQTGFALPSRH